MTIDFHFVEGLESMAIDQVEGFGGIYDIDCLGGLGHDDSLYFYEFFRFQFNFLQGF